MSLQKPKDEIDLFFSRAAYDLNCPHCAAGKDLESEEFRAEDVTAEMECGDCGKTFYYRVSWSYTVHVSKEDPADD